MSTIMLRMNQNIYDHKQRLKEAGLRRRCHGAYRWGGGGLMSGSAPNPAPPA